MPKNIVFYFSDQQRYDTVNETLMPNLCRLAADGVFFENNFTCQPVCGPARACLQTGQHATRNGCYVNGIALPQNIKPLASYFNEAGYLTAYIGKWHLASDRFPHIGVHCERSAIPKERQGEYQYIRAADVLEFTSHGYDGYVFDQDGNKTEFTGYRADCINDFALEFLDNRDPDKPFFLFISQLEPHHQNDRHCYEGYKPTVDDYRNHPLPQDLRVLQGDSRQMWPDYLSAINRLDYNVGKLYKKLEDLGIADDTVFIYTSDHGCHFKTRNLEYKRSCHDASIHTPLIIRGGPFTGGKRETKLTSLIDLPATLLRIAGIPVPESFDGVSLTQDKERDCVFVQISESQCGRAIRTDKWKYSVRVPTPTGYLLRSAPLYTEDFLYDLENDPAELHNLIADKEYADVCSRLRTMLLQQMEQAGEKKPIIIPKRKR